MEINGVDLTPFDEISAPKDLLVKDLYDKYGAKNVRVFTKALAKGEWEGSEYRRIFVRRSAVSEQAEQVLDSSS